MAAEKTKLIKTIDKFIKETNKRFAIKRVVLFGSFVDGRYKKYSDIDLAVVSDGFKNMNYFDRLVALGTIAWKTKTTEIEALGFTEKEYKKADDMDILGEIKKNGKIIYENTALYRRNKDSAK
ncbi:hypothetical protein COY52_12340 [Candidatus Desantisbacteria bacterium CG_4_10_14_0_8_um_filter_48_22]|uniref:Polymerase nucleotidyl transferase domain-containing protein n=1 Tax=Candidatus Desantisbacteria bacterium CG_4_10_14_0_8_um_filter_48_22 TaxID=1974543 RepID=A0A2M7S4K4_9BACT|nr:MAG: hypothetical protein AUJ67_09860 [Candidatus Desantisbacteria bacterium CG1_02_49_89]PIV54270.1 MAG: hypothetical protein COS16_10980 [Candidatus Desantisbacteria bacterium CG02_land_8_20_14_3_00_49_13]PIZ14496.1 MAG: hypothetical protein COY52_12340 [Candidatus Desantisbacteria bacterium CG_4_10_14_0_8_um_filter_48_22]